MLTKYIGKTLEERAFAALLSTIFAITFSIALGQLFAGICLAFFLLGLFRKQIVWRSPPGSSLVVAFILLAVILSASYGDVAGLWGRVGRLGWFIMIPVTASLVAVPGRDRKVIAAFLAGAAVLGVKDFVLYPILAWLKPLPDYLTALIDKGSMTDGQMLMLGVVGTTLVLMMAMKERRSIPWWGWVLLLAQLAGLLINFKRGSWFCAIILIGIMVLMQFRWRVWLVMALGLVIFFALPPVQTRMGQLKREFNVEGGGRLTMWFKIAPTLIHEHPAGVGFGCLTNDQMRRVFKRVEPNRNHLHANWAQVLVETGWAGLVLYLAWMAKMLLNNLAWIRRVRGATLEERGVAWVASVLLVGLLLNGLVEYNFGDTELMFIYAFLMGLTGACNGKSESVKYPPIMKQDEKPKGKPALSTVLIQTGVPAAVGLVFFLIGKLLAAKVLWGVSGVLLISGLFIPPVFNRIEQFGRWFGKGAGIAITWILLVPLFYLLFLPGRLILMARGIDPMCRKFPTDAPTYWVPRKPVTNLEEYKRQF